MYIFVLFHAYIIRPVNSVLLFSQGQFLLDNLIDCTKTLHFEMELSAPIDKRTQLTSIRREARARMNSDDSGEYGMRDIRMKSGFYVVVKALFHSSQKLTRKFAARTFIQSLFLKALATSLRVGFCDNNL